ncbi:hypothetical protein ABZ801_32460 [Actinomadura sp. NPDC047616]|uniref:hypothetical protein n=1 Tax=Actinomadura sp. NPDC047616 TaxID=3155914 RepID=UPI00340BCC90
MRTGCAPPSVGGAPTVLVPIAPTLTVLIPVAPTILVLVAPTLTILIPVAPTILVLVAPTLTILIAVTPTILVLVAPTLTILIAVTPTILVALAPALTISVEAAVTVATSVPVPVPATVANGITVTVPATNLVPSLVAVAVAEAALAALGVESTGGGRTSCAPLLLVLARASAEWTPGAPVLTARAPANVGALFVAPLARGSRTIRGPPERSIARAFVPPVLGPVLPVTCRTIFPAATRARSARTRPRRWTAAPPRVIA